MMQKRLKLQSCHFIIIKQPGHNHPAASIKIKCKKNKKQKQTIQHISQQPINQPTTKTTQCKSRIFFTNSRMKRTINTQICHIICMIIQPPYSIKITIFVEIKQSTIKQTKNFMTCSFGKVSQNNYLQETKRKRTILCRGRPVKS